MSKYSVQYKCKHEGCNEWAFTDCNTKADKIRIRNEKADWKCLRHSNPERVILRDSEVRSFTTTYETKKSSRYPDLEQLFFGENGQDARSGFIHGDKWRAWATDFKLGDKIEVEVRIKVIPTDMASEQAYEEGENK